MYVKDDFITQNNNLAKQQRWLNYNFISDNKITLTTNKHILTKNFLDNPLLKENLFINIQRNIGGGGGGC